MSETGSTVACQDSGGTLGFSSMTPGPRYQVLHRTTFEYGSPVTDSVNVLHLEPRTFPFQKTLQSFIEVKPATRLRSFRDLFDNISHHFELSSAHERLQITSRLRVQNLKLELPDSARLAGFEAYADAETRERIWPYLQESRYVSSHPVIWKQAVDLTGGLSSIFEKGQGILSQKSNLRLVQISGSLLGCKAQVSGAYLVEHPLCTNTIERQGRVDARNQRQMQRFWPVAHQFREHILHLQAADGVVVIQDEYKFSGKFFQLVTEGGVEHCLGWLLPRME